MPGAFSGTLLDADLRGTQASPFFEGSDAGGAAADPAAFLVPGDDYSEGSHLHLHTGGSWARGGGHATVTASDLLRQLDSGDDFLRGDFLLGAAEPMDIPLGMLGSGGNHSMPTAAAAGSTDGSSFLRWDPLGKAAAPAASSPGTPPGSGSSGMQPWVSAATATAFPSIPEETELPPQPAPTALPLILTGVPLPGGMPVNDGGSPGGAGGDGGARFNHSSGAQPQAQPMPLLVPVPSPRAALPRGPSDASLDGGVGPASSTRSGTASPDGYASDASEQHAGEGASAKAVASGRGKTVPRIASMPNLHLSLAESGSGAVRKKAAARATKASKAMQRSRSHSDFRSVHAGASNSAAAVVAAAPVASDATELPHSAFLTPSHLRKGKGGRQPAADPRLDPRMDPKKAARIMANRLSAAKSKQRQKSQPQKQREEEEEEGGAPVAMDSAEQAGQAQNQDA